jgi:hypothetical protein
MTRNKLTRRTLLASAIGAAVAAAVSSCAREKGLSDRQERMLLQMARRLYPHDALADAVYAESLADFHHSAVDDVSLAKAMQNGFYDLDLVTDGNWLGAMPGDQVAALRDIERSEFFATVLQAVRTSLYAHPVVWELIGFEGSSVEYGGYIDRGFDDIDWLPED